VKLRRVLNLVKLLGPMYSIKFCLARLLAVKLIKVRVAETDRYLWLRPKSSDLHCLWQIFGLKDSRCELESSPTTIIDGGSNVGYATVYYALRYPGAKIISVEPDEENVRMMQLNCEGLSQVSIVKSAIWGRETHLRIRNPEARAWAFQVEEVAPGTPNSFAARTIVSFLADEPAGGNVLVKLDIEGAEKNVFSAGDLRWIDSASALVIEIHDEEGREIVERAMESKGFQSRPQGEKLGYFRGAHLGVGRYSGLSPLH
jgi:FkbM family methyltransferase